MSFPKIYASFASQGGVTSFDCKVPESLASLCEGRELQCPNQDLMESLLQSRKLLIEGKDKGNWPLKRLIWQKILIL